MEKLNLDEIVIVEGKDDVTRLKEVINATIIPLNGSSGLSKKKINLIKELSLNNKLILITDPDFTGKKIREKINMNVKENITNLYVSRTKASLNGDVGVENVEKKELYKIFFDYMNNKEIKEEGKKYVYTIEDMLLNGLTGEKESKNKREILGDILKIGYYNTKSLLNMLNGINLSKDKFDFAVANMNKKIEKFNSNGIIFGKFIPLHKGHINFIEKAAKEVEKLFVTICFDKNRDYNLLINSTLPKIISESDRLNFLIEELRHLNNVKVLILREEGINSYPNGWQDWTKRVEELLLSKSIKISTVFTNEIQDKENYEKYFINSEVFDPNLTVILFDKDRIDFNVSSTKIRANYEEYINYLPKRIVKFLQSK